MADARLGNVIQLLERVVTTLEGRFRAPFRCPICNGRGSVPAGFYDDAVLLDAPEGCRACDGAGVLWGGE